jgi:3-oxoacyl-[acyl-carrier protein] reductase
LVVEGFRENRVALVTGGCGGIGRAVVKGLAEDGLRIAVIDRDEDQAGAVANDLSGDGHAAFGCDVSDEASVHDLFARVRRALGPVSVLVTAAGILLLRPDGSRAPIAETTLEEWERTQAVNARGTFLCFREFARQMPSAFGHGRVVSISSVAAQLGG